MIKDADIRDLERNPASISEPSYKERVKKIDPNGVYEAFSKDFAKTLVEAAVRFFPAATVEESLEKATKHLNDKLGEAVELKKQGKKPKWFLV